MSGKDQEASDNLRQQTSYFPASNKTTVIKNDIHQNVSDYLTDNYVDHNNQIKSYVLKFNEMD